MKLLIFSAVMASMVVQPCLAQSNQQWKLATGYRAESFHTQNLIQFAQEVEQATTGQLKIEIHPNNSKRMAKSS